MIEFRSFLETIEAAVFVSFLFELNTSQQRDAKGEDELGPAKSRKNRPVTVSYAQAARPRGFALAGANRSIFVSNRSDERTTDLAGENSLGRKQETALLAINGEICTLGYRGKFFSLPDVKGLSYIQHLLQHPDQEFHSQDLSREPGSQPITVENSATRLGDAGPMLDAQAKQEYRRRLQELKVELEDQQERGNARRAGAIEAEIDFLTRELSRAVGWATAIGVLGRSPNERGSM